MLNDGRQYGIAPFDIETIRARLLIMLSPLLLIALWALGADDWLIRRVTRRQLPIILPVGLRSAFAIGDRVSPVLIMLWVALNVIVLYNTIHQPPAIGYDAEDHYANVRILAQGRLPTKAESNEFFSPPIPYIAPAILTRIGASSGLCPAMQLNIARMDALQGLGTSDECTIIIRKFGQLQNVIVSLLASFLLLRIGAGSIPIG